MGGSVNRRQVMQGVGAASVMALVPEVFIGTATAGGLRRTPRSVEELPAFLADLDSQVARLRAAVSSPQLRAFHARLGLPADFRADLMESLLRTAAFRDLPEDVQADPDAQRRAGRELPRLGQQCLRLARMLRDLPDAEGRRIRRLLRDNPELKVALRERRREAMHALELPEERVAQTGRLMDRLLFRLERQPTRLLCGELVDRMRRVSADAGIPEEEWDAYIALDVDAALTAEGEDPTASEGEDAVDAEPSSREDRPSRSGRILRLAGISALISLGLFLLGLAGAGLSSNPMVFAYLTMAAGVVLLVTLILLCIAFVVFIVERYPGTGTALEEEQEGSPLILPDELIAAIRSGGLAGLSVA